MERLADGCFVECAMEHRRQSHHVNRQGPYRAWNILVALVTHRVTWY